MPSQNGFYLCGLTAIHVAEELFNTTKAVEELENGIKCLRLNQMHFEKLLKMYLVDTSTFKVELYAEHQGKWDLAKFGSPGMTEAFSDELSRNGDILDTPCIMTLVLGLQEGQRTVATAYLHETKHEIGVGIFVDNAEYKTLEVLFLQLNIKECILQKVTAKEGPNDYERVKAVAQSCHVMVVEAPKIEFKSQDVDHSLLKYVDRSTVEQNWSLLQNALCKSALAALIRTPMFVSSSALGQKFKIKEKKLDQFLKLDRATQKALNLFPLKSNEPAFHSLYGLINRCCTVSGKRLLKTWLKQPLTNVAEIENRLNVVEVFVEDCTLREQFQKNLRGLGDLDRLLRKLEKGQTQLLDLCQLYKFSIKLPVISDLLQRYDGIYSLFLQSQYIQQMEKFHDESHLRRFEQLIEVAIDTDRIPEEYLIDPKYDPQLQGLAQEKHAVEERVRRCALSICKDLGLEWNKAVKLDWHKAHNVQRRCLRISLKEERIVRKKLQTHFIVLETLKDGVKFTSDELMEIAEEYQDLTRSYEELQEKLVLQVSEISASFLEVFEPAVMLISELDVLCSFACITISAPTPYIRPKIVSADFRTLSIKGGRHPLVEAQDGVDFVKNDCCMELGESCFQIITGPNMGGKSTYIRQVALIVFMAQIGCFVPCDEAAIPIRDCIFTRVGAGDYQQRGISTFMAEMIETAAIMHGATSQSLVIIDELGRGTSTCGGLGIAWAVSEHLIQNIGALTLFASHFHELTSIDGPSGVKNLHMEATIDQYSKKLAMLYQIRDGVCDRSFGIHVAESVQFPRSVTYLAQKTLMLLEHTEQTEAFVRTKTEFKKISTEVEAVLESITTPREQLVELQRLLKPIEKLYQSV